MPNSTPRRLLASRATSWPARVMRKAVFDGLRYDVKRLAADLLQRRLDHAGPRNAHVDDALRLAHAVKRPGHKRIVLHRIAEYHQFGGRNAVLLRGALSALP